MFREVCTLKRIISNFIVVFLLVLMLSENIVFASSDYTEISLPVINYSFDNGLAGYKIINGNHSNIITSENCLSVNDNDNRAYEIETDWMLVASGVSYRLQVDSIQSRISGYPYVYINYYDGNRNKLDFRPSVRITANSNQYSAFMIDYNKAPENARFISISLTTTSAYTGNVKFDNLRLSALYSEYTDEFDDNTAVDNIYNQLQISFSGNDCYSSVSGNLNLPTMTYNGVLIYWLSDNADIIDNCGIVNNSAIEGEKVTLTAFIIRGEVIKTKEFQLSMGAKISNVELYNQSFELGTAGYTVECSGLPKVLSSDFSFSENKSLEIITGKDENVIISGHKTEISPLESYTAYVIIYKKKGDISLSLEFCDTDSKIIKSETRKYNGDLSLWNTLGVVAQAPSDAVYAHVKLMFSAETECCIDDFNISKTFTDLGMPIQIDYVQSAAMGKNEKGKDVIYTVITNETADGASKFVIVDIATKSVVKTIEIEGVAGAGAIVVDNENNVYIGTYEGGKLFKYIPGQDFLIDLGTPIAGQTHIVSLAVDSKGTVYGGTYPGCYVFSLRKNSTDYEIISPNENNQPFVIGEQYAKSIAVDENNNILYVGTATHAKLYRYDMNTRVVSEILPDVYESNTHIYNLKYENGKLFAYVYPEGKLLVMSFNANGEPVTEKILSGSGTVSRAVNNISYFINSDRKISGYNYITGEVFALNNQKVYTTACLMDVVDMNDDKYPGLTFVAFANGIQRENRLVTYNISNNSIEISKVELPTVDYSARSVMTGPEGSIYTSNHLGGGVGVYNPVNDMKNMFVGLPQAESGIALNGKMYFGTYTMGKIYEYNPEEPWQFESNGEINPRRIDTLGNVHEQDRPFASAAGDGLVFFGTAPQYGKLGGAIAIYNPNNLSEKYVVRNIVKDQSVTALAYKDGYLYGGTSVWGGIGATPTQKESKFFIFDVKNKVKVREFVIAEGSQLISSLIVGTDGNIWGLCDGYLFMYNPDTDVIEYNMLKFPEMNSGGSVTAPKLYGANLVCGKDGYIYGVTGSKLFKLNPYSRELEILRTGKFISATTDFLGNIYYSDYSSIWKYSCFDSKDVLTVKNAPDIATYPSYYDDGNIAVFFSEYLNDNNFNIKEYGMIFSRRDNPELEFPDSIKLKSNTVLNSKGQFGIALKNSKQLQENEYYIRTYVIYENNGNIYNAYGNTIHVR